MEKHIPTCAESFDRIFCWDLSVKIRQFFPHFVIKYIIYRRKLWTTATKVPPPPMIRFCRIKKTIEPYNIDLHQRQSCCEHMEGTKHRRAGRQACILDTRCEFTSRTSKASKRCHKVVGISHFFLIGSNRIESKRFDNKVGKTESPPRPNNSVTIPLSRTWNKPGCQIPSVLNNATAPMTLGDFCCYLTRSERVRPRSERARPRSTCSFLQQQQ